MVPVGIVDPAKWVKFREILKKVMVLPEPKPIYKKVSGYRKPKKTQEQLMSLAMAAKTKTPQRVRKELKYSSKLKLS